MIFCCSKYQHFYWYIYYGMVYLTIYVDNLMWQRCIWTVFGIHICLMHTYAKCNKMFKFNVFYSLGECLYISLWKQVEIWPFFHIHVCISYVLNSSRLGLYGGKLQMQTFNILRPRQFGHLFTDDIFKFIFVNEKFEFWLKFHWSLFPRVQLTICKHWFR